jgi:hypothetical protein
MPRQFFSPRATCAASSCWRYRSDLLLCERSSARKAVQLTDEQLAGFLAFCCFATFRYKHWRCHCISPMRFSTVLADQAPGNVLRSQQLLHRLTLLLHDPLHVDIPAKQPGRFFTAESKVCTGSLTCQPQGSSEKSSFALLTSNDLHAFDPFQPLDQVLMDLGLKLVP